MRSPSRVQWTQRHSSRAMPKQPSYRGGSSRLLPTLECRLAWQLSRAALHIQRVDMGRLTLCCWDLLVILLAIIHEST